MRKEIYSDLHRGYAENFNSIFSSCMALLIASLGVLGGYGYVFLNCVNCLPSCWFEMKSADSYNLNALCFTAVGACGALCAIMMLLMYQGVAGRQEQFIIDLIRRRNGIYPENMEEVLHEKYTPYGKQGFQIMQGLYGEIVKILISINVLIYVLTFIRMIVIDCCDKRSCLMSSSFLLLLFSGFFFFAIVSSYWCKQSQKYNDLEKMYIEKKQIITNNENADTTE